MSIHGPCFQRFTGFGRKSQPSVDSSVTFVKFGFVEGVHIMDLLRFLGIFLCKASWSSVLENWFGTLFLRLCSWSPRRKRPGWNWWMHVGMQLFFLF